MSEKKGIIDDELRKKIEESLKFMLVPIQEGDTVIFERRRVSDEERTNALLKINEIINELKAGKAQILPQSKNE